MIRLDILGECALSSPPRMSTKRRHGRLELLQGTLDLLILRTLRWGPAHGHAIAKTIERGSDDVLSACYKRGLFDLDPASGTVGASI